MMKPWNLIASSEIPAEGGELRLYQRGEEYSIMIVGGGELMNSRVHGSEDALAELGCRHLAGQPQPQVLIGGLGMGFTLAAALEQLGPEAEVLVAELIPAVVTWNRDYLGHFASHPLDDPRSTVSVGDVAVLLKKARSAYDAILLDVDNGPEGLTHRENDWLYSPEGLHAAFAALRPDGVLAVWSAGPDQPFAERLRRVGFLVEEQRVRAHGTGKGARHTIWIAQRSG
jgi:spermidine synthase